MSTPEAGSMSMLQAAATGAPALSRLNPVTKLLVVVVVALALTFVFDPVTPAVVFVLVLLGGRLFGKLRLRDQLRPLLV
ncbi:MAG: hypothetical protein H5T84_08185, partial [Thermoleophilia bacterium]|nr:hypothetical protein [Thermoleophilia bacterium]